MSRAPRKSYPVRTLGVLWLSLVLSAPLAGAAETCLKQVFDRFCLGGDFDALLRQAPPLYQQNEGDRRAAVYWDGHGRTYVMAYRGQIYKVVQESRPSSQLHFQDLAEQISRKYGNPEDRSRYPARADTRAARVVAIRRGEGQAEWVWNPGDGWLVELSWTRELGVALSYLAEDLDRQQHQAMEQGL